MKKALLLVPVLAMSLRLYSQQVVASSGDFHFDASVSLEWTLGELATQTYSSSTGFVTEGLHQSNSGPVTAEDGGVSVYPSPTSRFLNVINTAHRGQWSIQIVDLMGRIMVDIPSENDRLVIDLSQYAQGYFFVRIPNGRGRARLFKIEKLDD